MNLRCPPHALSLRVWHPSMDPNEVTRALGMSPDGQWRAGERCVTPKGTPLAGTRDTTYWHHTVKQEGDLLELLADALGALEREPTWVQELIDDGGRVELYVWFKGSQNAGDTLSSELLSRLAKQRVSLSIEVVPQ